jgi:RNA polymerase sigma factor (sigma-70 family)
VSHHLTLVDAADADLVAAVRCGDRAAFDALYARHAPRVAAVCRARVRPDDVDDVVQDTFARAYDRLETLADAGAFGGWVRAIAVNLCADTRRRSSRTVVVDQFDDVDDLGPQPDELVADRDEADHLVAALATLGRRDRRALWLRDAMELSIPEVAADLGTTEGSMRVMLTRARRRARAAVVAAIAWVLGLRLAGRQHLHHLGDVAPVAAGLVAVQLAVAGVANSGDARVVPAPPAPVVATIGHDHAPTPIAGVEGRGVVAADMAAVAGDARTSSGRRTTPPTGAGTSGAAPDSPSGGVTVTERPADPADGESITIATEDDEGDSLGLELFLGNVLAPLVGDDRQDGGDAAAEDDGRWCPVICSG